MVSRALAWCGWLGWGVVTFTTATAFAQGTPQRQAFFGQTHSHTSWSLDAYIIGNHLTGPEDAYKFSLGQPVKHPAGFEVKLKRPLDFHGVTDHSEYAGMIRLANDPSSPVSKLPIAEKLKVRSPADVIPIFKWLAGSLAKHEPIKELLDPTVAGTVWKENIEIADKYYQPGKFTTFVAYEWTSAPNSRNMHRNVFFKDTKKVPALPFTAIDSSYPNDLWNWMDGQRKAGNELLAISHNANLSDGIMFPVEEDYKGRPIDAAWAQQRMTNEPLTEINQIKGTSETHPALSPNDEFANFEIMSFLLGTDNSTSRVNGSYVRQAYQNGLAMQQTRGYNPYKMGVVGASDSHNTVVAYTASNFFGQHGGLDASPKERLADKVEAGMAVLKTSTSGLGGVWAEENTRESIFDAMQRHETFGTSGVRIKVRLFGGWEFKPDVLKQKDWAKIGYAKGVPMGGDLPASTGKRPHVHRVGGEGSGRRQPRSHPDREGLDRERPDLREGLRRRVVRQSQARPDDRQGAAGRQHGGHQERHLHEHDRRRGAEDGLDGPGVRSEPGRVLLRPRAADSRRRAGAPTTPSGWACHRRASVPATVQERAWTSPIWYTPTATARQDAPKGVTVADLKGKGAVALDDAQLKQLVVGQTLDGAQHGDRPAVRDPLR